MKRPRPHRAFTSSSDELGIVVAILAILLAIAISNLLGARKPASPGGDVAPVGSSP